MASIILEYSDRARALWQTCLASAFRTALACIIVGCITIYGPASLQNQIGFPAFSYVTVILVVTDARLGDTFLACWLGLYATVQSLGPAMLSLWMIGPARLSSTTTALAVALGSLVVAMPERTHLVSKRIALGQIVLVYVIGFINGIHGTDAVMHTLRLAASTAVGIVACVLALLIPIPRTASHEVKNNCKLLTENASERLKLFVKAFCAEDNASARASISQAKSLAASGFKFLQNVKKYQESMQWERLPLKFLKPRYTNPGQRMQDLEMPLRGMEMALNSNQTFPIKMINEDLKDGLVSLEKNINIGTVFPSDSPTTVPESLAKDMKFHQTLRAMPQTHQDLPSFFFLFCTKALHSKLLSTSKTPSSKAAEEEDSIPKNKKPTDSSKSIWSVLALRPRSQRLMPAFKCSLSVGLSVLFGSLYSRENGYWAGLPVAISLAASREATFRVANVKAQGTVLGTVYGVVGCFVFERFFPIRFLSLLPWFIFTSFLQRSHLYGQAGGISAVIGALLILGRKNFGPPSEFAITRIVETFIGLSCSIAVDLLLQPTRSSGLAKIQLSRCLEMLEECVGSMNFRGAGGCLRDKQQRLREGVSELSKFIGEAEVEPNFWFLPFNSGCYGKLFKSLSNMVDLMLFSAHSVEFLERESRKLEAFSWKDSVDVVDGDVEVFKEMIGPSIRCFQEVTEMKSVAFVKKELERKKTSYDIEMGTSRKADNNGLADKDKVLSSFLENSQQVVEKINVDEGGDNQELKSQMVLCLSALGFCINGLIRETREIEEGIKELVQWENPSTQVNLYEISSMLHTLQNN